jgi:hypothetical protein
MTITYPGFLSGILKCISWQSFVCLFVFGFFFAGMMEVFERGSQAISNGTYVAT